MAIIVGKRDNNPFTSDMATVSIRSETAGQRLARDVNTIKKAVDVAGDIGDFAGKVIAAGSYMFGSDPKEIARLNAEDAERAKARGERDAAIKSGASEIEAGKRAMDEARKLYSEETDLKAVKDGADRQRAISQLASGPSAGIQNLYQHPADQAAAIGAVEFPEVAKMVEGQAQIPQGQLQLSKDKLVMDTPPDVSHLGRGTASPSVSIADKGPVPTYNLDAVDASSYQEAGPTKKMAAYRGGAPTFQTDEQIEERARAAGLAAAAKIITPTEARAQIRDAYMRGDWKRAQEVMKNLRSSQGYGVIPKSFSDVLFGSHIAREYDVIAKELDVDKWVNKRGKLIKQQLDQARTKSELQRAKKAKAEYDEWVEMTATRRGKAKSEAEIKRIQAKMEEKSIKSRIRASNAAAWNQSMTAKKKKAMLPFDIRRAEEKDRTEPERYEALILKNDKARADLDNKLKDLSNKDRQEARKDERVGMERERIELNRQKNELEREKMMLSANKSKALIEQKRKMQVRIFKKSKGEIDILIKELGLEEFVPEGKSGLFSQNKDNQNISMNSKAIGNILKELQDRGSPPNSSNGRKAKRLRSLLRRSSSKLDRLSEQILRLSN
tara:strand:+ start:706 stop:2538 length:1833 start_codon:yes stop_codon:yes gene_type:complete